MSRRASSFLRTRSVWAPLSPFQHDEQTNYVGDEDEDDDDEDDEHDDHDDDEGGDDGDDGEAC